MYGYLGPQHEIFDLQLSSYAGVDKGFSPSNLEEARVWLEVDQNRLLIVDMPIATITRMRIKDALSGLEDRIIAIEPSLIGDIELVGISPEKIFPISVTKDYSNALKQVLDLTKKIVDATIS